MKKLFFIYILFYLISLQSANAQSLFKIFEKGKVGFIDSTGKVIIKPVFNGACDFTDGLASVRVGSKYGYIDKSGNFVIPPQYDWAWGFSEGLAVVNKNKKFFYIDKSGNIPFETNYDFINNFLNGRAYVHTYSNKTGIIDKEGKLIVDTIYDGISNFLGGNAVIYNSDRNTRKGECGLIDSIGNIIVPLGKYWWLDNYPYEKTNELINVNIEYTEGKNSKNGFINRKGELVLEYDTNFSISQGKSFNNGLIPVQITKNWIQNYNDKYYNSYLGYMDTLGKIVFSDTNLREGSDIYFGASLAQTNESKYFLIKRYPEWHVFKLDVYPLEKDFKRGEIIAREVYKDTSVFGILDTNGIFTKFKNNISIVDINITNDKKLDESGRFLYCMKIPYKYKNRIEYKFKYGLCDLKSNKLSEPIFDIKWFYRFKNGLLRVMIDDSRAYVDLNGKVVWKEKQINRQNPDTLDINFLLDPRKKLHSQSTFIINSYQYHVTESSYIIKLNSATNPKIKYPKDKISLIANTKEFSLFEGRYAGYKVYFINPTLNKIDLYKKNSYLETVIQILDLTGKWIDIESYAFAKGQIGMDIDCIYGDVPKYDEQRCTEFTFPLFKGEYKTKFRIRMEQKNCFQNDTSKTLTFYSNEFEGSFNSGQLWKIQNGYLGWQQKQFYPELDYDEDWMLLYP